jgi:hypothetical protein
MSAVQEFIRTLNHGKNRIATGMLCKEAKIDYVVNADGERMGIDNNHCPSKAVHRP